MYTWTLEKAKEIEISVRSLKLPNLCNKEEENAIPWLPDVSNGKRRKQLKQIRSSRHKESFISISHYTIVVLIIGDYKTV